MKVNVEFFRPIIINNIKTKYLISDLGRVRNSVSGRILKNNEFKNKREYVNLYINGIQYRRQISRLVAKAFIPNPDNLPVVNHKDGNVKNNYSNNLEWSTHKDNSIHARDIGLTCIGERSHFNKYPKKLIISICNDLVKGKTTKELSLKYDLSQSYITELYYKKFWRHVTKKYEFPPKKDFNFTLKYPIELKEEIISLIKMGFSNKEIKEKLFLKNNDAVRNVIDRIRKKVKGSTTIPLGLK